MNPTTVSMASVVASHSCTVGFCGGKYTTMHYINYSTDKNYLIMIIP